MRSGRGRARAVVVTGIGIGIGIAGGIAASVLAIMLVRAGWGGRRRLAAGGWLLLAGACAWLIARDGAWGAAILATAAMATALLLLLGAAWTAPAGRMRPPRTPPSITLPRLRIGAIGRRCAVFALVVPGGLAATVLLAFGAQAAAGRIGWMEADRTVMMLILQPTAWGVLAGWQMLRSGPMAMTTPMLACAAAGLLLWWPA